MIATGLLDLGFHTGIPAKVYHKDPCPEPSLSSSLAAELVTRSPAHAVLHHPRLSPNAKVKAETDSMAFGSVVHELALGRGGGFAVWGGKTWQGNDAGNFWDSATADGKTPIKLADYERATAMMKAVRAQLAEMGLSYVIEEGESEVVAIWKEGEHYARAMFDKWHANRNEVWDIKTTGKSAHPDQISKIVTSMNYDLRSEFYLRGASKLTGIPSRRGGLGYQFMFWETEPPFAVTPCYLSESLQARGRQLAQQAVDIWARCMATGKWPGYTNGTVEIAAPGWVEFEIEESGIAPSGDRIL